MIFLAFAENSIQLVPDGTLLLHITVILIMIFVLNQTLFRPINRVLDERERRTRGQSSEAHNTLRRVEDSLIRYERSLREARTEGYRFLEQARIEAMNLRQDKLSRVRDEVATLIEEEKTGIRTQSDDARLTLSEEAHRVAANLSAHILGRPIDSAQ